MTNRLSNIGDRFRSVFQLVDGTKFYGQLLSLPDTSRVSNFLSVRRYLRTNANSFIRPGMVMVATDGTIAIIAEHGEGFYNEPIYHHFKLFDVDAVEQYFPTTTTTDPVTGVQTTATTTASGSVYLSTQPEPLKVDGMQIPQQFRAAICNQEVHVSDGIGQFIVTKVDKMLGVYILEMKKI